MNDYRFRDVWAIEAAAGRLFDALVDLANYPRWWPDIRAVSKVDEDTAEFTCRAVLPYDLVFRLHRAEQDERAGRLRVNMTGDLEGYVEGVVSAAAAHRPSAAQLEISQEVTVNKKLLRRLAPIARPLFRANHAAMMRRGHRGLRAYLVPG